MKAVCIDDLGRPPLVKGEEYDVMIVNGHQVELSLDTPFRIFPKKLFTLKYEDDEEYLEKIRELQSEIEGYDEEIDELEREISYIESKKYDKERELKELQRK